MEWLVEAVGGLRHDFSANSNSDVDGALGDGIGDVLSGLEARGAEAIYRGSTGGVGDAGGEGGSSDNGSSFAIVDLVAVRYRDIFMSTSATG